ncbi:MAG: flavodoxin-dependent (E)-4-hydroxy-3-methylbut-2-enyl-diphosphate synthase [Spirochaetia bacterium]|nr:flavodoxin-dependent (E)-4-hydroxy-3-methylbut-2-enyl-diphosphate synthase [Spirochaetia bacterium]
MYGNEAGIAMYTNSDTVRITAGTLSMGGGAPVSIQTMWKKPLERNEDLLDEIIRLKAIGCDIIRFAVPDVKSAEILGEISKNSPLPLVADIHFDYKIALLCMDYKISKIRINPGNIGSDCKVKEVIEKAKDTTTPLRVGINCGSLTVHLRKNRDKAAAMILAAEKEIELFKKYNFSDAVFSLKSSDVETTIIANELFAEKYRFPLHLGVTEAGPLINGVVKNTAGLLPLLGKNIGATIRISLSSSPEDEIIAGKAILFQAGLRNDFINIVSCPKCGRAEFDVHNFLSKVNGKLNQIKKPVTIAIMGCAVNGPQEAKEADIGITGSGNSVVIFKKGEIIKKTTSNCAEEEFLREIESL